MKATNLTTSVKKHVQYYVGLQSWAGYTKHPVEILKVSPKRSRCRWQKQAFRHGEGSESNIPNDAIFRVVGDTKYPLSLDIEEVKAICDRAAVASEEKRRW